MQPYPTTCSATTTMALATSAHQLAGCIMYIYTTLSQHPSPILFFSFFFVLSPESRHTLNLCGRGEIPRRF